MKNSRYAMIPPTGVHSPPGRKSNHGYVRRGSQDSNLESPVLETGALPILLLPPVRIVAAGSGGMHLIYLSDNRVEHMFVCGLLRERREVNKWIARGASDYAIAGITGIPRGTDPALANDSR